MPIDLMAFIFVLVAAAFLAGLYGERWRARSERRQWWRAKRRVSGEVKPFKAPGAPKPAPAPPPFDAAEQLRIVMGASFAPRPLMSRAEAQVFYATEREIKLRKLPWRVMAQVNLGEILSSPDDRAFAAINSKRVDILVISSKGAPIAAIEYQGSGHYQGSAPARDAVKREALRRAGIRYIEMTPEDGPEDIAREIARIPTPSERLSSSQATGSEAP